MHIYFVIDVVGCLHCGVVVLVAVSVWRGCVGCRKCVAGIREFCERRRPTRTAVCVCRDMSLIYNDVKNDDIAYVTSGSGANEH